VLRATVITTLLLLVRALKLAISVVLLLTGLQLATGPARNCGRERVALPRVLPNPKKVNIKKKLWEVREKKELKADSEMSKKPK
jgi:hypothetical protein